MPFEDIGASIGMSRAVFHRKFMQVATMFTEPVCEMYMTLTTIRE